VFYNSMLEDVADETHRSRASGIGQFSNALGQLSGVLITLPLAGSRILPLVPAIGFFFILSLPLLFFFKESRGRKSIVGGVGELYMDMRAYISRFRTFFSVSAAIPMLIAFFFFNDAIITLSNNFSIVLERVFAVQDTTKSLVLIVVLTMSAFGGIISGWVADKIGALRALQVILAGWVIVLPIFAFIPDFKTFALLSAPVGLLIGSAYAVSRAYISSLLSKGEMTYGFSFYTLAERFSTFLGPLTWGGIITVLGTDEIAYRTSVAAMAIFIIAGLLVLVFFKRPKNLGFAGERFISTTQT